MSYIVKQIVEMPDKNDNMKEHISYYGGKVEIYLFGHRFMTKWVSRDKAKVFKTKKEAIKELKDKSNLIYEKV